MSNSTIAQSLEEIQHAGDLLRCWLHRTGLTRPGFLAKLAATTGKNVSSTSLAQWLAEGHSRNLSRDPDLHLALIKFFYSQNVITPEETRRFLQLCDFPGHRYSEVVAIFMDQAMLNPYQRDRMIAMFVADSMEQKFQDLEDDLISKLEGMWTAYLMDQYWFIRAINRNALALLEFR